MTAESASKEQEYDIIFVVGEVYFDHPLCGTAILKKLLEREGYSVGIIEKPTKASDIERLGRPKLFFGVSSGSIDSMVRNYTPLKKMRVDDKNLDYNEEVPDRAVLVYSNWIREKFKDSKLVIGGIEATLRRFTHFDYWQNRLRRSILAESRADIMAYGCAEKQMIEIAKRIKHNEGISGIDGTCIIRNDVPEDFIILPSHQEVEDKTKVIEVDGDGKKFETTQGKLAFCDMQNKLTVSKGVAQKVDTRYVLQHKAAKYTTKNLDDYYSMDFSRVVPKELRGFQFSVVTHRGCVGGCNFCSLKLTTGDRIVSRSEESIVAEVEKLTDHPNFKGQIDDLTAPSPNMYGIDCKDCFGDCIDCNKMDRSNQKLLSLLRKLRAIKGVRKINIRSGIRFDMASEELIKELLEHHTYDFIRIAPEHINEGVLKAMNKDKGSVEKFLKMFRKHANDSRLSYYFMAAHPGSSMREAKELSRFVKNHKNAEHVQVFTPTPMTISTCMYYTGLDPRTKKPIYVPYSYKEKKEQKRCCY